jgi:hypothetical protein
MKQGLTTSSLKYLPCALCNHIRVEVAEQKAYGEPLNTPYFCLLFHYQKFTQIIHKCGNMYDIYLNVTEKCFQFYQSLYDNF